MAMDTDAIPNLLGDARDEAPEELQEYFIAFEDYWERKLWHELTDKLIEFFDHPDSAKQRIPFFEKFIKTFANKINQLKLVTLGLNAATQYKGILWPVQTKYMTNVYIQTTRSASPSSTASQRASTSPPRRTHTYTPQSPEPAYSCGYGTRTAPRRSSTSASRYWRVSTRSRQ